MSTNSSITHFVIQHKERLHFIKEVMDGECDYYVFRFDLNIKNIFGFKKYLNIICFEEPLIDNNISVIDIEIPSLFGFIFGNEFVRIERDDIGIDFKALETLLKNTYFRYNYNEDLKVWKKIGSMMK